MLGEAVLRTPMSRPVYRRLLRLGQAACGALRYGRWTIRIFIAGATWPGGHLQPQVAGCVRAHAVLVVAVRSLSARSCRPGAAEAILDAALADGHAHNDMWWQPE